MNELIDCDQQFKISLLKSVESRPFKFPKHPIKAGTVQVEKDAYDDY